LSANGRQHFRKPERQVMSARGKTLRQVILCHEHLSSVSCLSVRREYSPRATHLCAKQLKIGQRIFNPAFACPVSGPLLDILLEVDVHVFGVRHNNGNSTLLQKRPLTSLILLFFCPASHDVSNFANKLLFFQLVTEIHILQVRSLNSLKNTTFH
jgi:hypothetical protein